MAEPGQDRQPYHDEPSRLRKADPICSAANTGSRTRLLSLAQAEAADSGNRPTGSRTRIRAREFSQTFGMLGQ